MMLFTNNVKKIRGANHKNGDINSMCKRTFPYPCKKTYAKQKFWVICYEIADKSLNARFSLQQNVHSSYLRLNTLTCVIPLFTKRGDILLKGIMKLLK